MAKTKQPNKAEIQEENKEFKAENKALKEKIEALENSNKVVDTDVDVVDFEAVGEDTKEDVISQPQEVVEEKLHPDDYITLVSLCPHVLNLRVGRKSGAETYRFEKFGETARVLYRDLAKIIDANKKFTKGGYYYILDKRVVRQHGLDADYDKVLMKEEIEKIFIEKPESAKEIFTRATLKQKGLIAEMVVNKISVGENIDMNLVRVIDESLGRDLKKDVETLKILET